MAKRGKKDIASMSVQEIFANFERRMSSRLEEVQTLLDKIYTKLEESEKKEHDFWSQYPWVSH